MFTTLLIGIVVAVGIVLATLAIVERMEANDRRRARESDFNIAHFQAKLREAAEMFKKAKVDQKFAAQISARQTLATAAVVAHERKNFYTTKKKPVSSVVDNVIDLPDSDNVVDRHYGRTACANDSSADYGSSYDGGPSGCDSGGSDSGSSDCGGGGDSGGSCGSD